MLTCDHSTDAPVQSILLLIRRNHHDADYLPNIQTSNLLVFQLFATQSLKPDVWNREGQAKPDIDKLELSISSGTCR